MPSPNRNLTKMNSAALSVLASKAKSPTVRNNARNVLQNRMNKALRVVREQRHLSAREKWTRGARLASRKLINNKLREIQPMLKRYRRYDAIARALGRINPNTVLSVGNRRAFLRSVLNEEIPFNPGNTRRVLQEYYNKSNWVKKPMSNRNWAILFSTNPNYPTIRRRLYERL